MGERWKTASQATRHASHASYAQISRLGWWLRNFLPGPVRIGYAEALRMALGVSLGLLITAFLSRWWGGADAANMWMVSSLGASAVLVFGMPASPLAQPWPVLGGTVVSALVGAGAQVVLADPVIACAVAVGVSILLMVPLRCMHPPGAGFAAFVVLEHVNGVQLIAFPIFFNVAVLVVCAVLYNALTGKRYPHPQHSLASARQPQHALFEAQDIDAALKHYNQVLDISRADLERLLHVVGRSAFNRQFGNKRCADIMSKPVFAVEPGVSLQEAWALMQDKHIKALPVVDGNGVVQGMVAVADFMARLTSEPKPGWMHRLRHLVTGQQQGPQTRVADLMDAEARTVPVDCLLVELVPMFSAGGCHHLPVVDAQNKLVGIVTQTDLIRALAAAIAVPADGA